MSSRGVFVRSGMPDRVEADGCQLQASSMARVNSTGEKVSSKRTTCTSGFRFEFDYSSRSFLDQSRIARRVQACHYDGMAFDLKEKSIWELFNIHSTILTGDFSICQRV